MTVYMLSVHMADGEEPLSDEEMQASIKDVDAFNTKVVEQGQ